MTRFTSECDLCAQLLTEYIAAGNEIVNRKDRSHSRQEPTARQLASALIDNALKRRENARKQLFNHKQQHH